MADLALSYASIGAAAMIAEIDRVSRHAEQMAASVTAAAADISGSRGIPAIPKAVDKLPAASGSIDHFKDKLEELRKQFTATGSAIERAHLGPQIRDLENSIESANESIPKATKSMGESISEFASEYALAFGAAAVTTVIAFGKASVEAFMEFETAMADLSAITGATGAELDSLGNQAKEMGIGIEGGAAAAVEGFKIIKSAMADLRPDQLTAVTKEAIALAQASGLAVPDAAKSLSAAMNQMQAKAEDAGKIINVLGAAAKFGAAEIPATTDALLVFGGVAASAKLSIEESAAAIQTLAKFGIEGAEAGTKLRNIFLAVENVKGLPKEALEGLKRAGVNLDIVSNNALPAAERLKELGKVMQDGVAAEAAFGKENIVAAQRLLGNIPLFEELTKAVTGTNVAYEQAEINNNTLAHSFLEIKNQIGNLMIEIGAALAPTIKLLTEAFVPAWEIVKETFLAVYGPIYETFKSIGGLAEALGFASGEGNVFVDIVKALSTVIKIVNIPMRVLWELLNLQIKAVTWVITAFKDARQAISDFGDRVPIVGALIEGLLGPIKGVIDGIGLLKDGLEAVFGGGAADEITNSSKAFIAMRTEAFKVAKEMGATNDQVIDFSKNLVAAQYSGLSLADTAAKLKMDFAAYLESLKAVNGEQAATPPSANAITDALKKTGAAAKEVAKELEYFKSKDILGALGAEKTLTNMQKFTLEAEAMHDAITDISGKGKREDGLFGTMADIEASIDALDLGAAASKFQLFAATVGETFKGLKDGIKGAMVDIGADLAIGIGEAIAIGDNIAQVFKDALRNMLITIPKMAGMAFLNAAANPLNSAIALPLALIGLGLLGMSGIASGLYKASDAKKAAAANAASTSTTTSMPTPNRSGLEAYNGGDSKQPLAVYFDGPEGEKFIAWADKKQIKRQSRRG